MAGGYPLYIQGVRIRTSEALYQACRFPHLPHVQRLIIEQASPMTAKMKSKPYREDSRPDWDNVRVKVMRWCLRVKLAQNWSTFSSLLLRSGNSPIVEESRRDDFWGAKRVGQQFLVGRNVLGRLLMELREVIKSSGRDAFLHVEPPAIPQFLLLGSPITVLAGRGVEMLGSVEADGMQRDRDNINSRKGEQASLLDQHVAKRAPQPTEVSAYAKHPQIDRIKAYPAMKDSGVEWLGEVPVHWDVKKLKYSVSINDEVLPEATDPSYEMSYVDISSVDQIRGIVAVEDMVFEDAPSRARRVVRDGDTIVSTVRTYLRAIAPVWNPADNTIVSTGFAVVRPRRVSPAFLSYALREAGFIDVIVAHSTGVSYPAVNASVIGTLPIPLPERDEQRAIADYLDGETLKIDTLVAKKRMLIKRVKEKRTALISRTVTSGLPPDAARAAGLDPHPKLKPTGIDWLGDVPEHWDIRRIATESTKITNGFVGPTRDILVDDGVRYLQSLHIKSNRIVFARPYFVEYEWSVGHSKSILAADDVLIVQTGDIGQVAVVPEEFAGANCHALIIVSPRRDRLSGAFLAQFLSSTFGFDELKRIQTGALHPHLNCGLVRDVRFPLPPMQEQVAIVDFLNAEITKIDTMIDKVRTAIERLLEYRSALITAAVTGKIDVSGTRLILEPSAALPGISKHIGQ